MRSSEDGECLQMEGNSSTTNIYQVVLNTASTNIARRILTIIIVYGCCANK